MAKLQEIAEIRTGLVLSRKKAKTKMGYPYKVFTLASLDKSGIIQDELIENFESNSELEEKLLTKDGDILIRLSQPYTATYITKPYRNILIPSLIAVIRIKSEEFLPEYIKVYLNSEKAKEQIRKEANGTVIETVSTKSLKEIEIPEISIERQQDLIHFTNAYLEEKKLIEEIQILKEKEYQYVLNTNICYKNLL